MLTYRNLRISRGRTALLLIGLVALAVSGFILLSNPDSLLSPSQEYKSAEYSFDYPSGWVLQDPKTSPVAKIFKVWIKKPGAATAIGIRYKTNAYRGDLATLRTELGGSLGALPGFQEVSSREITISGTKALRYEFTKQEKTDQGQTYTAHQVFVTIPRQGKVTYLVATAEEGQFKQTEAQFDSIFQNFELP